jgi:hypothetical protein
MTGSKESLQFNKFEIYSNEGVGSVDLRSGTPRIEYRESVFVPYVTITAAIVDTGNAFEANDGSGKTISLLDSIKCQGTEKILFDIEDGNGNKIKFTNDNDLRVDSTSFITESFKSTSFILSVVSKEAYENTFLENRCRNPYSGKMSDIVADIIKNNLKSNKKVDVDVTLTSLNQYGKDRYPFEMILDIQKLSVPDIEKAKGNMAGYLFWQTSKGYHFKSLDKLFDSTGKTIKRYILNQKVDTVIPAGFDDKILYYFANRTTRALDQFKSGAFGTVLETWDPITNTYVKAAPFTAKEKGNGIIAGKYLPRVNPDFLDRDGNPKTTSRLANKVKAKGQTVVFGDSIQTQVEKTDLENYSVEDILQQSKQNYRQKFNMSIDIIVPSDFSLHAGDLVYCEFPELSTKTTVTRSLTSSGIYMIADLCHFGTRSKTFTGLHLVRDSYGVKNG